MTAGTSVCTHRFECSSGDCPIHRGEVSLVGESGTVVPLFTGAGPAPGRPSQAGAGDGPHKVLSKTVKFGGSSPPHLMWAMQHRARGPQPSLPAPRPEPEGGGYRCPCGSLGFLGQVHHQQHHRQDQDHQQQQRQQTTRTTTITIATVTAAPAAPAAAAATTTGEGRDFVGG